MKWCCLAVLLASACTSPVVGAACRSGLTECDGRCVDTSSDALHCGACERACGTAQMCLAGGCVGADDAGADDGGTDDAGADDGSVAGDAGMPTIRGPLARQVDSIPALLPRACELGELACDGACVRADSDDAHCGACGRACATSESCVSGTCISGCEPPFVSCGGRCVDAENDPDHCGGCGVRCATGLCIEGACQAPLAGHLVVIGHDYEERRSGMDRVVGNAVLLPARRTVRVLQWNGGLDAPPGGAGAAIDETAALTGRSWTRELVSGETMSYRLAHADALLLYPSPTVDEAKAARLGLEWGPALRAFLNAGGTIVALVGPTGSSLDVLAAAGLLGGADTTPTEITGSTVHVTRPADAIAVGVPLRYRGERATVRLALDPADAVVADDIGPVVVHRTFEPPTD